MTQEQIVTAEETLRLITHAAAEDDHEKAMQALQQYVQSQLRVQPLQVAKDSGVGERFFSKARHEEINSLIDAPIEKAVNEGATLAELMAVGSQFCRNANELAFISYSIGSYYERMQRLADAVAKQKRGGIIILGSMDGISKPDKGS